jgi:hypothetical protein
MELNRDEQPGKIGVYISFFHVLNPLDKERVLLCGASRDHLIGRGEVQPRKACQDGGNLLYVAILQFGKLFFVLKYTSFTEKLPISGRKINLNLIGLWSKKSEFHDRRI